MYIFVTNAILLKKLVIVLFFLFSCDVHAHGHQNAVDLLSNIFPYFNSFIKKINVLDSLSLAASATNPHEGIKYGQQMLSLAEQSNYNHGIAKANTDIGINYAALADFTTALSYDHKGLDGCIKENNKEGVASNLVNIGLVHLAQADYSEALQYFYDGLHIYEGLKEGKNIAHILVNIGDIYFQQKNYSKALQNFDSALKKFQKLGLNEGIARCQGDIGAVYEEQGNDRKALDYYLLALYEYKKNNNKNAIQVGLGNIGIIYTHLKHYAQAMEYHFKALALSRELDNKSSIAINLGNIGETYFAIALDDSDEVKPTVLISNNKRVNLLTSINYLRQAINLYTINHLPGMPVAEFSKYLADAYYYLGNYKNAFELLKGNAALSDSLLSSQAIKITNVETQQAIALKNKQLLINEQDIKIKQRNIFIYTFITVTLILIIIIAASYIYRYRKSNVNLTKENKETLNLLQEAQLLANVGNWNVDVVKNNIFWSEGTRIIYGVDEHFKPNFEAFIHRIHPEDREETVALIMKSRQTGETIKHRFRIIRSDGIIRVLNNITKFQFDKEDKLIRIYGISQDITELDQIEETLRRSEANIKTIFDNADTAYILIDSELNIVSFNKLAQQFFHHRLQSVLAEGNSIVGYFPAQEQDSLCKSLDKVLAGESIHFESKYARGNFDEKWYALSYVPVHFSSKNISGIIISATDITAQKRSEQNTKALVENLQKKNNDLNQFAYIISHNLRAPIVKILGLAGLFSSQNDFKDNKIIVDYIADEVNRLDSVINDLNEIITIRDVQFIATKDMVVFANKLKLITEVFKQEIEQLHITISTHFGIAKMVTVKAYLYSILYNLISNAIKYRSPQRVLHIHVQTEEENGMVKLSVRDNGMGIDLEKNGDKLFGLYNRFNSKNIAGRGIGLYLVKTQVEALNGKLSLESIVDQGTTFYIYLPQV